MCVWQCEHSRARALGPGLGEGLVVALFAAQEERARAVEMEGGHREAALQRREQHHWVSVHPSLGDRGERPPVALHGFWESDLVPPRLRGNTFLSHLLSTKEKFLLHPL